MSDIQALDSARRELGLSFYDVWLRYIEVGGNHDAADVRAHITGQQPLPDRDHDHIVLALNEAYSDAGADHPLPYRHR